MQKNEFNVDNVLSFYLENVENIHKLVSLLKKHCDSNKDLDDLYKVSEVINVVEEKLNTLAYDIYTLLHRNDEPVTLKSVLKKIKQHKKICETL